MSRARPRSLAHLAVEPVTGLCSRPRPAAGRGLDASSLATTPARLRRRPDRRRQRCTGRRSTIQGCASGWPQIAAWVATQSPPADGGRRLGRGHGPRAPDGRPGRVMGLAGDRSRRRPPARVPRARRDPRPVAGLGAAGRRRRGARCDAVGAISRYAGRSAPVRTPGRTRARAHGARRNGADCRTARRRPQPPRPTGSGRALGPPVGAGWRIRGLRSSKRTWSSPTPA